MAYDPVFVGVTTHDDFHTLSRMQTTSTIAAMTPDQGAPLMDTVRYSMRVIATCSASHPLLVNIPRCRYLHPSLADHRPHE